MVEEHWFIISSAFVNSSSNFCRIGELSALVLD